MYLQSYQITTGGGGRKRIGYMKEVYLFLWYIGSKITFVQISDMFRVSRSAAWKVVVRVSTWIVSIGHEFITWPEGDEVDRVEFGFHHKKIIPGIIGAIDCTHFHIKKPPHESTKQYYNASKFNSLILQAIVDTDHMFRDIHCGEPGSSTNARVLEKSHLYSEATQFSSEMFPNNTFLIGNSAFPNKKWLVTPFPDDGFLGDQQETFNELLAATSNVVHQAFGLLKIRFQRVGNLKEQRQANFAINIIVSACVLHNVCILQNDRFQVDTIELEVVDSPPYANDEDDCYEQQPSRRDELFSYLVEQNVI